MTSPEPGDARDARVALAGPMPSHQTVRLARGGHDSPDGGGVCAMELASMLAGERFTDHPLAVSPVLAAFVRGYNDGVDDARRQSLIPLAAECCGTRENERRIEQLRRRRIAASAGGLVRRTLARAWLREGATVDESGARYLGVFHGRMVARHDDDDRHARVLELIRELIAAGGATPPPVVPTVRPVERRGAVGGAA